MIDPRQALQRLVEREPLTRAETEELFGRLMDGELSETLKAALLVALKMKGEAADEICGAAAAMRRRVIAIPHHRPEVIDTCGTGGDAQGGRGTFNVSTAAATADRQASGDVTSSGPKVTVPGRSAQLAATSASRS